MKKRLVSLLSLICLLVTFAIPMAGCGSDFDGEFSTMVVTDGEKAALLDRIEMYDGLSNIELVQAQRVTGYTVDATATYNDETVFFDRVVASNSEEIALSVKVDAKNAIVTTYNDYEAVTGFEQYYSYNVETKSSYELYEKDYDEVYEDYYYQYVGVKNVKEKMEKESWMVDTYLDTDNYYPITYCTMYDSEKYNITESVDLFSKTTEKGYDRTKGKEIYVLNDYAAMSSFLKPFVEYDNKFDLIFKPGVMIFAEDSTKYKLTYTFTSADDSIDNGIIGDIIGSLNHDVVQTTYEVILVFGDNIGEYKSKVTVNSNFSSAIDYYEKGFADVSGSFNLEMEINASTEDKEWVSAPRRPELFRQTF